MRTYDSPALLAVADAGVASPASAVPAHMPHRLAAAAGGAVPYVFDVVADDPELGLKAGDRVVVTFGAAWPVSIVRQAPPNYGRVLGLFEDGVLAPRDADPEAVTRLLRAWAAQQGRPTLRLEPRSEASPR